MPTGRRGPAPESAAVKKAKGNPGKRKIIEQPDLSAPNHDSAIPSITAPEWLSDGAVEIWDRLAARLAAMKLLQQIDSMTFGRYCEDFARWLALSKNIIELGETYKTVTLHGEFIKLNPASMMASRLNRELMMMEQNFGLNPADRQRIFVARADKGAGGADLFRESLGERGRESNESGLLSEKDNGPDRPVGYLN